MDEIISTISLVKLRRHSSMTLPTRENVDSELMLEIKIIRAKA
jgi:hypothetical protein